MRDKVLRGRGEVRIVIRINIIEESIRRIVENEREMGRKKEEISVERIIKKIKKNVEEKGKRKERKEISIEGKRRKGMIGEENIEREVKEKEMIEFFNEC